MPMKGTKWDAGNRSAYSARGIDQGAAWEREASPSRGPKPLNLHPRPVPAARRAADAQPIDRWMSAYFQSKSNHAVPVSWTTVRFARRAYLDVVGLLAVGRAARVVSSPTARPISAPKLVKTAFCPTTPNYADHWLTFWKRPASANGLQGHRLHRRRGASRSPAGCTRRLLNNKPYNQFRRRAGESGFPARKVSPRASSGRGANTKRRHEPRPCRRAQGVFAGVSSA